MARVEDEGAGIPPENLPRIFQPFFTTKGSRGSGLGLSMALGVMERVGGSITAENRPEGSACFTLTFPIPSRAPAKASRAARQPMGPSGAERRQGRPGKAAARKPA